MPLCQQVSFVSAKVFRQGPYSRGSVNTALNCCTCLPLGQPYSGASGNYDEIESVGSSFFASHFDIIEIISPLWVRIQLPLSLRQTDNKWTEDSNER
jgi:hypothetical protein